MCTQFKDSLIGSEWSGHHLRARPAYASDGRLIVDSVKCPEALVSYSKSSLLRESLTKESSHNCILKVHLGASCSRDCKIVFNLKKMHISPKYTR